MIDQIELMRVIDKLRQDTVFVPTMRGNTGWVEVSSNVNRDIPMGGVMGKASSFALGMCLAQPETKFIVYDGDGSLVMNLATLVTIGNKAPKNFYHFVLDNGVYATTGGQPVPNAQNVKYEVIAEGSGYPSTYAFDNLEDFTNNIEGILSRPGPVFVAMKVVPEIENEPIGRRRRWNTRSRDDVVRDLQNDLGPRIS